MATDVRDMSAQQVIDSLALEYLEGEGCWIRVLWRTPHANAIYGLITPQDFSALHRLGEDEAWTYVAGDAADMLILHPDGTHERVMLGTDVGAGQVPHYNVPAGTWQGTLTTGEWTLVTCVLAPPFSGFELATRSSDLSAWQDVRKEIDERMRIAT
jgi:predicted cupin superfamily sugar epimerase